MDAVRWLTDEETADALGIGRDSARVIAKRKRWPRCAGNDRKARVGIPEDVIASRMYGPGMRWCGLILNGAGSLAQASQMA